MDFDVTLQNCAEPRWERAVQRIAALDEATLAAGLQRALELEGRRDPQSLRRHPDPELRADAYRAHLLELLDVVSRQHEQDNDGITTGWSASWEDGVCPSYFFACVLTLGLLGVLQAAGFTVEFPGVPFRCWPDVPVALDWQPEAA